MLTWQDGRAVPAHHELCETGSHATGPIRSPFSDEPLETQVLDDSWATSGKYLPAGIPGGICCVAPLSCMLIANTGSLQSGRLASGICQLHHSCKAAMICHGRLRCPAHPSCQGQPATDTPLLLADHLDQSQSMLLFRHAAEKDLPGPFGQDFFSPDVGSEVMSADDSAWQGSNAGSGSNLQACPPAHASPPSQGVHTACVAACTLGCSASRCQNQGVSAADPMTRGVSFRMASLRRHRVGGTWAATPSSRLRSCQAPEPLFRPDRAASLGHHCPRAAHHTCLGSWTMLCPPASVRLLTSRAISSLLHGSAIPGEPSAAMQDRVRAYK